MRPARLFFVLTALTVALSLQASPAQASPAQGELRRALAAAVDAGVPMSVMHDSTGLTCSGYLSVEKHWDGVWFETRRNVCVGRYSSSPPVWEAVERDLCYRDGVQFGGSGAPGGCRWTGRISLYVDSGGGYVPFGPRDWCNTCGGDFIGDSGRQWSYHVDMSSWVDCYPTIRGLAYQGQVRYKYLDGTVTGLYTTQAQTSPGVIPTNLGAGCGT